MARVTKRRLVVHGAELMAAVRTAEDFTREFPQGRIGPRNAVGYIAGGGHRGWIAYRTKGGAVVVRETEPELPGGEPPT
jgi:hypothetical protein